MEQKQLDELEDSFFGEEFIEEMEDIPPASSKTQEIKIEPRDDSHELRLRKNAKKASAQAVKKSAAKKSEKVMAKSSKEQLSEEKPAEKLAEAKEHKEKKNSEAAVKTETVNVKPAKEQVKETKPVVETSSPVNPWEDEAKSSGLFKEVSTWKAFTGVVLVLLVLSLFTQGFNFSEKKAVTGAAVVNMQEAGQKVLTFVNTELLQAPFQAEIQSSEELDTLYKFTLAVAGQTVDSYVTKDGKLFFPQGLELDKSVLKEAKLKETELPAENEEETVNSKEKLNSNESQLATGAAGETTEETEEPAAATGETVKLSLKAKKWVFEPNVLRVKKGSKVVLTVVPTGLDFTFAVPSLGVEQEVAGTTDVEFVADKEGTFDFTCGSCEDWRGMRGNLVVEPSK